MICDNHMHTRFSPDSSANPEAMVKRAIELGFKQITFTDHCDPGHPEGFDGITDAEEYVRYMNELKAMYSKEIYIGVGLEIGYMSQQVDAARRLSEQAEYVINSVHVVAGSDCYYKHHFDNVGRDEAYADYFNAVIESLNVDYSFDAVGHLGYIERKAPYGNGHITYAEFKEPLDRIFDLIIEKDAIMEINTNTGGKVFSLPSVELAQAFYKRGGRRVTTSSDAHTPDRIGERFDEAERLLKDAGFKYLTAKRNGKFVEYKL